MRMIDLSSFCATEGYGKRHLRKIQTNTFHRFSKLTQLS